MDKWDRETVWTNVVCLTIAVMATVVLIWLALYPEPADAHEAGPLKPPGVVAQALPPPPNAPAQDPRQPLGWRYGWECCSGMDCAEIPQTSVHETPDGYQIDGSSDEAPIAYNDPKRIKESKDGEYHWCAHRSGVGQGKTICLYVPGRGY